MNKFILLLIFAAHAHAGWFGPSEEHKELAQCQQELKDQRHETGGWEIIAGIMAIGGVILFMVGTALGSKARREVRHD